MTLPQQSARRTFALVLTGAALAPAAAAADAPAGISGRVLDEATRKPIPGIAVAVVRQPATGEATTSVVSDRKGHFTLLTLDPGTYAVTANVAGRTASCTVERISSGAVRSVTVLVSATGRAFTCEGPRVHADTVNSDDTADVYRIH